MSTTGTAANSITRNASISPEGRYVVFGGFANNLAPGASQYGAPLYLRDRLLARTELVGVSSAGVPANAQCDVATVSAGGRYVVFTSSATNLDADDTSSNSDVFVRDRHLHTTERVSRGADGAQPNGQSMDATISLDGRYVAFRSSASNLVHNDTNGRMDVFVRDRLLGTTERVSVSTSGAEADGDSIFRPSISSDGRFVAFTSSATNFVPLDTNGLAHAYVRDRVLGTTELASRSSAGAQGNLSSYFASLSSDGRWLAFASASSNLVDQDTNGAWDIFVRDLWLGATVRASVSSAGVQANTDCDTAPAISADGRFVAFATRSFTLDPSDAGFIQDVFVRDLVAGTTALTSFSSVGTLGNNRSELPAISADGRYVAFASAANNLVPGDVNGFQDVFVRDRLAAGFGFCFGDGALVACPCANEDAPTAGAGCRGSLGPGGRLDAAGTASISADNLVLSADQMPAGFARFLQGTSVVDRGSGTTFGDGLLCVTGSLTLLATKATSASGTVQYPEPGDAPISLSGGAMSGDVRHYQVWYRDGAAFCTPATFNTTNGWSLVWGP